LTTPVGSDRTRLIVLRGNSASGKTTTAMALRLRMGRETALVQQDVMRRVILKEHDVPGGINIDLIELTTRFALDRGYDVILEGILSAARYGEMLRGLLDDHLGSTSFYYFDVSLAETFRRHATRPLASEFGQEEMRRWYREADLLGVPHERVIPESRSLDETVSAILSDTRRPA
jgi:predicted kinase